MRLYEHESKKLFQAEGIPVPESYGVLSSPEELKTLGGLRYPVMAKALVLVGGRGKAGGIGKASNIQELESAVRKLLGTRIHGYDVRAVLLEEAVEAEGACYAGITMNPASFNTMCMVSPCGGVDIEAVARETPDMILKLEVPENDRTLPGAVSGKLASFLSRSLRLGEKTEAGLKKTLSALYALYQKYDCKTAEINPLLISKGRIAAADAKIVLDDNALYRLGGLLGTLHIPGVRHDVSERTANELRAKDAGFPYVDLLPPGARKDPGKIYVGLVPGGAGYGIFSIDEVTHIGNRFFGGRVIPVNFMDSGGGPTLESVAEMFHLLMDNEIVDLVLTSRFGGISSCDIFIRGLVGALRERHRDRKRMVPVYGRMVGTDLPGARDFLEKAKKETPGALKDLDIVVGNQVIMADIMRRGIGKMLERREAS